MKWVLLIICFQCTLHASGFMQKPGEGFFSADFSTYRTASYWDQQGQRLPSNNKFFKREYTFYGEYGLTPIDTVSGKVAYDNIQESANPDSAGFADFEVAWRHLMLKCEPHLFSVQVLSIIPSGPNDEPSIRYAAFAVELSLLYARSFKWGKRYGFFDSNIGYRWYKGYPSDQIRASATLGYDISPKIQLIGACDLEYGVYNGIPYTSPTFVLFDPNYRLLKIRGIARYRICKKISVIAGIYQHVWGRMVGMGFGYNVGLWMDF